MLIPLISTDFASTDSPAYSFTGVICSLTVDVWQVSLYSGTVLATLLCSLLVYGAVYHVVYSEDGSRQFAARVGVCLFAYSLVFGPMVVGYLVGKFASVAVGYAFLSLAGTLNAVLWFWFSFAAFKKPFSCPYFSFDVIFNVPFWIFHLCTKH